jgi:hypothetical protein
VALVQFQIRSFLFRLWHKGTVEISPRAFRSGEAAAATSRKWSAHRLSEPLDCSPDDGCRLSGGDYMRRQNSKLALALESREECPVLGFKSLDARAQIAGRAR